MSEQWTSQLINEKNANNKGYTWPGHLPSSEDFITRPREGSEGRIKDKHTLCLTKSHFHLIKITLDPFSIQAFNKWFKTPFAILREPNLKTMKLFLKENSHILM